LSKHAANAIDSKWFPELEKKASRPVLVKALPDPSFSHKSAGLFAEALNDVDPEAAKKAGR